MAERLPATLRAYRLLTTAAAPFVPVLLALRLKKGKEHPVRLAERRGESKMPRPPGPLVWLHGASVGELNAVLPLIDRIRAHDLNVLVTTGTVTSAGIAEKRLPPDVIHQFAPVDIPQFTARFLDHWKPDLGLFIESDLWPGMILAASERGVPLILVNGRLSERSFNRWRMFPRTIGALLRRFDLCLAQSSDDGARYAGLGAPRITTSGNLKLDAPAPGADEAKLAALAEAIGRRPVVAAASTHPGEEAAIMDAHRRLKHSFPGLLTLIAPRHPERGQGIADIAKVSGLTAVLRSQNQLPRPSTDIYVVDTMGELGLVYRLARIVLMGGSLVSHGGQNPIEAIKLGAAVLHGPYVANFAEIYGALDAAGGAEEVADSSKLAIRIGTWLKDAAARQAVADKGLKSMETLAGALERTVAALEPYLMEFRLDRRPDHA